MVTERHLLANLCIVTTFISSSYRNYYTLKPDDVIMIREDWRKLEKESYLKVNTGKISSKKTVNIKASDMIKKRPEVEDSSADEADLSDNEKVSSINDLNQELGYSHLSPLLEIVVLFFEK